MAHDIGLDRRYLDLVVFADQFERIVARKHAAAILVKPSACGLDTRAVQFSTL
jgi:hypothetical protein